MSVDEVLSLPLDPRPENLERIAPGARTLIGMWCARGRTRPARTLNSSWLRSGRWPSSFWGEYVRERIARQVACIRHWRVIEGDYSAAPKATATWFVDPPYIGAQHYLARVDDYGRLGAWCQARHGLVIVCEQDGAAWLPFDHFRDAKSIARGTYREVVYVQRQPPDRQISLAI